MQVDQYRADLGEDQPITFEPCAIAILRVGDRVIAPKLLETRIARVDPRLEAAKERLECQIDSDLNVLQDLTMHQLERFALGFPIGKERLRIVQPNRRLPLFPRIAARCERLVIHPPALFKLLLKETLLAFRQPQAI